MSSQFTIYLDYIGNGQYCIFYKDKDEELRPHPMDCPSKGRHPGMLLVNTYKYFKKVGYKRVPDVIYSDMALIVMGLCTPNVGPEGKEKVEQYLRKDNLLM